MEHCECCTHRSVPRTTDVVCSLSNGTSVFSFPNSIKVSLSARDLLKPYTEQANARFAHIYERQILLLSNQ